MGYEKRKTRSRAEILLRNEGILLMYESRHPVAWIADRYGVGEQTVRNVVAEKYGSCKSIFRRSLHDEYAVLIKAMLKKGKTLREMGKVLGISGERVRQIMKTNGWKPTGKRHTSPYPMTVTSTCEEQSCRRNFRFVKTSRQHVKKYCSEKCRGWIKGKKICGICWGSGDGKLMKSGRSGGKLQYQKWICRSCARERDKKYGTYISKAENAAYHRRWYKKNGEAAREASRKWYHTHRCKCHAHSRVTA